MIDKEIFAQKLSKRRVESGLSQRKLAGMLCVSPQAVSKWETGVTYPDIELLPKLSNIFHVSIDYILDNNSIEKANIYNEKYQDDSYYWGVEPNHSCYEVMKILPPIKPYKVLDMGCGEGKEAIFFAKNGYDVTAFDLAKSGIEKTKKLAEASNVHINAFVANINEFVPNENYDIIYSSGVLDRITKNVRGDLINSLINHTNNGGIHAIQLFVTKPFIEKKPVQKWKSGELFSFYANHKILYCDEYISDCNSGGIAHKHCSNKIIVRIIK